MPRGTRVRTPVSRDEIAADDERHRRTMGVLAEMGAGRHIGAPLPAGWVMTLTRDPEMHKEQGIVVSFFLLWISVFFSVYRHPDRGPEES